jgi:hypothetical protein
MGRPRKPNVHRTTFNLNNNTISKARDVLAKKETLTDLVEEGLQCVIRRRTRKAP